MSKQEQLDALLQNNQGVLKTADAVALGVSRAYLGEYVRSRGLERVAHGVYLAPDAWEDGLYLLQTRFPQAIFSHETALYLLGLAEREPLQYAVTVPENHNASGIRAAGAAAYRVKQELYPLGIIKTKTPLGHSVNTYNAERTVCDLLRNRSNIEIQDLQAALKSYVQLPGKNLPLLMEFAGALRVEKKLRPYLEVLL
jgi:predicted transcriptional regulator of viral defense system